MEEKTTRQNGAGEPDIVLASMVGDFDRVTDVTDWAGYRTEQAIEFKGHLTPEALEYIQEHNYKILRIHDNGMITVVSREEL